EKRGMPTEIALLPIIESAYNPKAYSTSHASGIWQFIPSTGKHFGLDQNLLYDGRRDILAATDAALDYLQKLYNMFGNWELALAAYNWGEGSVGRAIAKNQANGEPTGYLSLRMPPETRNYVPKLIAVKNIVMNPAAYGLTLNSIPNSPYFASVKLKQHMDVAVAARLAEVPLDEFVALNPAYNKPLVAGIGKPTLLLPVDKVNSFSFNLENNERPLSSWQTYTPRRGETLASIAKRFDISLARLKEINAISGRNKHVAAQTLLVPVTKSGNAPTLLAHIPQPEPAGNPAASGRNATHTVARGDTVLNIAKRYGMTPAELKSRNNLKSNNLARGQKLTVLASSKQNSEKTQVARNKSEAEKPLKVAKNPAAKGKHTRYVVKRGD
ncbi:MAG: transglycosylase SLT domain-containing protein, partial [Sulfurimicrobium sp.]|nr:transglycosylase SLT domain-containing protein [Sulfurimicrobium sp.]